MTLSPGAQGTVVPNRQRMRIVVAADIHGVHAPLRALFHGLGAPVTFVSPWDGEGSPFASEQEAATAFHAQDGLARYQQAIAAAAGPSPACLIGFSVGATALWLHAGSAHCHPGSHAFLYYGSRIREHTGVLPRCAVSAVFAEVEPAFTPAAVARQIASAGVACTVLPGTRHGFMNPRSPAFCAQRAQAELERIRRFLGAAPANG